MTYNHDQLKEMIPIYLNGQLSKKEHIAFEQGLQRFPDLATELAEFAEIQESYSVVQDDTPIDADRVFARIQNNIRKQEVQTPAFSIKAWFQQLGQILVGWYRTPALSWSVAGLQFAALVLVIALVPSDNPFHTYSADPSPKEGIHINVVFNQGAQEIEIRTLLQQIHASIVDGPTAGGLYVLALDAKADMNTILQKLSASGIVRLAEKALSRLRTPEPDIAPSATISFTLAKINGPVRCCTALG